MINLIRSTGAGLRAMLVFTVLLGLLYPAVITVVAQVAMPHQASGSIITARDRSASRLLAQRFDGAEWLQPRPSAAGDDGYDAQSSSGSNLGPNSTELREQVQVRRDALIAADGAGPVPPDAVTASSSGLDPHISPAYADRQVARIARARQIGEERVRAAIAGGTHGRSLGILGEPRVNVIEVNAALADG